MHKHHFLQSARMPHIDTTPIDLNLEPIVDPGFEALSVVDLLVLPFLFIYVVFDVRPVLELLLWLLECRLGLCGGGLFEVLLAQGLKVRVLLLQEGRHA